MYSIKRALLIKGHFLVIKSTDCKKNNIAIKLNLKNSSFSDISSFLLLEASDGCLHWFNIDNAQYEERMKETITDGAGDYHCFD